MPRDVSAFGRRIKLAVGTVVLGSCAVVGAYLYWAWHHPLDVAGEIYVVKPGTSLRGLARDLHERGVLPESYSLTWLGYVSRRSRRIQAGEYRLRPGMNVTELLDMVVAGRVAQYPVVLVEGWNFRQVLDALRAAPRLTWTLDDLSPPQIMARLGHPDLSPEGRFFPDTYYYSGGRADIQILESAFNEMQRVLQAEWDKRDPGLPLKSMDDALILASIVEKETSRPDERRIIAGVFVNRLRKGMRLQSDPTVIYGLGERFDGNIHLRDLRTDTPYNTYTRNGLPPTPIAMPGRESLAAAVNPAQTEALYFVARGDGSHVFSATLEAHSAAVAKYQLGGHRNVDSGPDPKPSTSAESPRH